MKQKLLVSMTITMLFFSTGFDYSEEEKIIGVVRSMIAAINEKDADSYIEHLNDYFISQTYGSKEFIRKNMSKFGYVRLLKSEVSEIKSYYAKVQYKLKYKGLTGKEQTFYGEIILDKTDNGWEITPSLII